MPFPQKAMLLAAGLGERLQPLTLQTPKPLIPIAGRPLITYNLMLLKKYGVREVVINLYHLGEQIEQYLKDGKQWGIKIHYSWEKEVLGTGGGLWAAREFLKDGSFVLMNADILVDLNLQKLAAFHRRQNSLATLVVSPSERADVNRWVFVDGQNKIITIDQDSSQNKTFSKNIFTGVQVVEPEIFHFPFFQKKGEGEKKACLIQDIYTPLLKGLRKNNFPFSHPIFGSSLTDLQSQNPRVGFGPPSGFAPSGRPNLTQIWARNLGSYSCADPKAGKQLSAYSFDGYFRDVGTVERYNEVKREFSQGWPYTALRPEDFSC